MVDYKALVTYVVKALVTHPEEVVVTSAERDGRLHVDIAVASDDMGRVIGRKGSTITAIRKLVSLAASKTGETVGVDILE